MKKTLTLFCFALFLTAFVKGQSITDSLIVHLPVSGNANDTSGRLNHGTVSGATLVADRHGNANSAYQFDGINDFISIPYADLFNDEWTYSMWFYVTGLPASGYKSVLLTIGGSTCDQAVSLTKDYFGYNGLNAGGYSSPSATFNCAQGAIAAEGNWHFLVAVKSNDSIKLFYDGVKVCSSPAPDAPCYDGSDKAAFLGKRIGNSQYFKGTIDDVRIYSRAISDTEALTLFNGPSTGTKEINTSATEVTIYPNPSANGVFNLLQPELISDYYVVDALGKKVHLISDEKGSFQIASKGIYFVISKDANGAVSTTKIIY